MQMPQIFVKQKLDPGIYKSYGGGQEKTVKVFKFSPRNLRMASNLVYTTHCDNIKVFGNIGCGYTWLEVDGEPITEDEVKYILDFNPNPSIDEFKLGLSKYKEGLSGLNEWLDQKVAEDEAAYAEYDRMMALKDQERKCNHEKISHQ
jgi:hypothetical protein